MIRPVGDVFQDGNVTLKVVESKHCRGCYYKDEIFEFECSNNFSKSGFCVPSLRENKDNVIFEVVTSLESQESQILQYLESGKSITQLEALNMFDCMRLSARVHRLKKRGHNVKTLMVSENGKHFAKYYL